ncbi:uncharacterized protein LOC124269290 [Haliotis rubra]|uniref:uncharacterized protein LOC124269290 n=1 Tax=Haliotis rubra TaxID=36100 RepID=UPI001EE5459F|nr:uncharacterized protein LOC124269290 [Haliotis rubra]
MASFMAKSAASFEGGKRKRTAVIDLTSESDEDNTTTVEQDDDSDGLPVLKFEGRKRKRTFAKQTRDAHTTKEVSIVPCVLIVTQRYRNAFIGFQHELVMN